MHVGTVAVRHNHWRRGHLGAQVHAVNTTVIAWEENAYEKSIAAP